MTTTNEVKKTTTEELTLNQRLYEFIQKNRKVLLISLIALIAVLAAIVIIVTVRERMQANAILKVDGFSRRYNELKNQISGGDIIEQAEVAILLVELADFQRRSSGFASARAYSISADIFSEQRRWSEAEGAWANAARAARRTYLAPIALFNAAVAAEEQGNIQAAIDYYSRAIGFGNIFHSAARAQFAIGRLEEDRNNREAALGAYRNLLASWPHDQVWVNLAQSRIIMLGE